MLVGIAGGSHWSLAVEPFAGGTGAGLQFDVACRVRAAPGRLASSYRLLVPARMDEPGAVLLEAAPGAVCSLRLDERGEAFGQRDLSDSTLTIRPPSTAGELPATIRWRYSISLAAP
jgi:hypothetical protein